MNKAKLIAGGLFIVAATCTVAADGGKIKTDPGAIKWDDYTPIAQAKKAADVGCNRIILRKRNDAAGLLKCDIRDEQEFSGKNMPELVRLEMHSDISRIKRNISFSRDLLQALALGEITSAEAIRIRQEYRERELKAVQQERREMITAHRDGRDALIRRMDVEARFSQPAQQQPTSITCKERDIFGNTRCDFQ